MSIFREYDIRGVVGSDLTPSLAEKIGRAYGEMVKAAKGRRVAVGRDVRTSSPDLHAGLLRGLVSTGTEVLDVGICPTPLLYFSLFRFPVDGGVMITGSHNPAEYNGFKLCIGKEALYGDGIQAIRKRVEAMGDEFAPAPAESPQESPVIPLYQEYLREQFRGLSGSGVKVVLDSGNGTAGLVAPPIFRSLGCEVVELYSEPDGHFPNHHPDPTVAENLEDLIRTVKREGAAFGVGYDGDADRIGVVDDRGNILWGDQLMVIFSRDILMERPGATIISEVKASQLLFDDIRRQGGRAVMWRTGHSLIKAKLKEEGAALAGEMSGHLFFADRYFGFDDAIYASVRLLDLVIRSRKPLSDFLSDLPPSYATPEIRVDCPDSEKFGVVLELKENLKRIEKTVSDPDLRILDVITIDGVRVVFEGGWGLVRASNTQPVLVLRFEAVSPEMLSKIRGFIEGLIRK
jgi:phosphomannomutase/phosphoglucomutase